MSKNQCVKHNFDNYDIMTYKELVEEQDCANMLYKYKCVTKNKNNIVAKLPRELFLLLEYFLYDTV
jgi:hypothetical protein